MPKSDVYNIDCMAYMATLPDKAFNLAIVDPPYGIGITSSGRLKRYNSHDISWDNNIPNKNYFDELLRVSENQIIWGGNYFLDYLHNTKCFLIYDKKQPQNISFASCEFAWTSFESVSKTFYYSPMSMGNRIHTTQKPVELYAWILKNYAKQGDKILDTHLGSGSSRIAAYKLGFDFVGCEIDKEYFDKSVERFNRDCLGEYKAQNGIIIKQLDLF